MPEWHRWVSMTSSSLYDLKEVQYGGDLSAHLKQWRKNGLSFDQIANLLSANGAPVHGSTVVRWARERNIV